MVGGWQGGRGQAGRQDAVVGEGGEQVHVCSGGGRWQSGGGQAHMHVMVGEGGGGDGEVPDEGKWTGKHTLMWQ